MRFFITLQKMVKGSNEVNETQNVISTLFFQWYLSLSREMFTTVDQREWYRRFYVVAWHWKNGALPPLSNGVNGTENKGSERVCQRPIAN